MDTWTVGWVAWGGTGVYLGIFALQINARIDIIVCLFIVAAVYL